MIRIWRKCERIYTAQLFALLCYLWYTTKRSRLPMITDRTSSLSFGMLTTARASAEHVIKTCPYIVAKSGGQKFRIGRESRCRSHLFRGRQSKIERSSHRSASARAMGRARDIYVETFPPFLKKRREAGWRSAGCAASWESRGPRRPLDCVDRGEVEEVRDGG